VHISIPMTKGQDKRSRFHHHCHHPTFFLVNTHDYVGQPKGILVFHSQGEFVMVSVAMTSSITISSTNWLTWFHLGFSISAICSLLRLFARVSMCLGILVIILFGRLRGFPSQTATWTRQTRTVCPSSVHRQDIRILGQKVSASFL